MNILHSGALDVWAGGPALSTWLTIKGLRNRGHNVTAITAPLPEGDRLIDDDANPIYTKHSKFGTLAYVPGLRQLLRDIKDIDIYHIQGIWMLHGHTVSSYASSIGKPYVVTLRGMLYPEAIAHNALIKRLSMALYQRKILTNAAAVQCTCREEMEHFRNLGFKTPVAIIPNPIETTGVLDSPIPDKPTFTVGYLGRLHPRKRVERLIHAMYDLKEQLPADARLRIIGGGDAGYTEFLKSKIAHLGLTNVEMTGFLSGKEKDDAIKSLSILAVPSDFENFGNIVTEALVRGVPVIASKGMPWQELPENKCGWWIENSQEEINKTILESFRIGDKSLHEMGRKGRELISRHYSGASLGEKMNQLYSWILKEGDTPDFLHMA